MRRAGAVRPRHLDERCFVNGYLRRTTLNARTPKPNNRAAAGTNTDGALLASRPPLLGSGSVLSVITVRSVIVVVSAVVGFTSAQAIGGGAAPACSRSAGE